MNKRQLSEIELMEERNKARENAKIKENLKKQARPSLLTRYFSIFLDFIITAVLTILLLTFIMPIYLNSTNYDNYRKQAVDYLQTTHLFDEEHTDKIYYKEYDKDVYDNTIINYYTTNEFAKSKNMIDDYNKAKLESKLYSKIDGQYIINADVSEETIKAFLKNEYEYAISFAKSHPVYVEASNKSFTLFALGVAVILVITTTLFYLVIPLCTKEGETLSQLMLKICVIDTDKIEKLSKIQVLQRFFFSVFFNYYIPGAIYLMGGAYVMLLPILISAFVMGFDKLNRGIHEQLSHTMTICKHRSNAEQMLKAITHNDDYEGMSNL